MFSTQCPNCGAPVSFRSSASTTAICSFCKSTLARSNDVLERIGTQGELLEDYSRIQIGTAGKSPAGSFTVIGRVQQRFNEGYWNEWYVIFDNGKTAWLSDASNQFALLEPVDAAQNTSDLPLFEKIQPGLNIAVAGGRYIVVDKRISQCIGGQGELPFPASATWQSKTIDCRRDEQFITVDFSEEQSPQVYKGRSYAFEAFEFTLLRDVKDRFSGELVAGKLASKTIQSLNCTSCAKPLKLVAGLTQRVICTGCGNAMATLPGGALESIGKTTQRVGRSRLQPGDEGKLRGITWTVLGALLRHNKADASSNWEEYLLYEPIAGFQWLVNDQGAWQIFTALNEQPLVVGRKATLREKNYQLQYEFEAEVRHAAGSFNWQVKIGDTALVSEFKLGQASLSRERTANEETWSEGKPIDATEVMRAFGKTSSTSGAAGLANTLPIDTAQTSKEEFARLLVPTIVASAALITLTIPAWLMGRFDSPGEEIMWGLAFLWFPYLCKFQD